MVRFLICVADKREWDEGFPTLNNAGNSIVSLEDKVIETRIGKVNTLISVAQAKVFDKVKAIMNFGTAGCMDGSLEIGSLVQCNTFYQRDMFCQTKDRDVFITPGEETEGDFLTTKSYDTHLLKASCFTGDSFVLEQSSLTKNDGTPIRYRVVDMEAYALAKFCKKVGIPFVCVKYITDFGDHDQWELNLKKSCKAFTEFYTNFCKTQESLTLT
ncbi:MAG: hypothetical protein LBS34_02665 [Rickettsiales bacterium]|jgi:adenosylhomocysteine nucleosidase|nr:hypothetical protein [Rickettsiales bacterium]